MNLLREVKEWYKFFRILLRLTWAARKDAPCRQKLRRIVRAAEKAYTQ